MIALVKRQESIGTTLVLNGGGLTPRFNPLNNKVLSVEVSVVPSRGVRGNFGAWPGVGHFVSYPNQF